MDNSQSEGERRDTVLRRMLATPKALVKDSKEGGEPKPITPVSRRRGRAATLRLRSLVRAVGREPGARHATATRIQDPADGKTE